MWIVCPAKKQTFPKFWDLSLISYLTEFLTKIRLSFWQKLTWVFHEFSSLLSNTAATTLVIGFYIYFDVIINDFSQIDTFQVNNEE